MDRSSKEVGNRDFRDTTTWSFCRDAKLGHDIRDDGKLSAHVRNDGKLLIQRCFASLFAKTLNKVIRNTLPSVTKIYYALSSLPSLRLCPVWSKKSPATPSLPACTGSRWLKTTPTNSYGVTGIAIKTQHFSEIDAKLTSATGSYANINHTFCDSLSTRVHLFPTLEKTANDVHREHVNRVYRADHDRRCDYAHHATSLSRPPGAKPPALYTDH